LRGNDLKATRAGQTWSGVEKKRHHCDAFLSQVHSSCSCLYIPYIT